MNHLHLKLFATLRERVRASELEREFPDGITVAEIWGALKHEFPALAGHRDSVGFAVNQEYVEGDYRPRNNDEVAFIPPVSGGAADEGAPWVGSIAIVGDSMEGGALERGVGNRAAGAIVTFGGRARCDKGGRKVVRREYEAYEPMALREMHKLARQAGKRWGIVR